MKEKDPISEIVEQLKKYKENMSVLMNIAIDAMALTDLYSST